MMNRFLTAMLAIILLLGCIPATFAQGVIPSPPQTFLETAYKQPTGRSIAVGIGGNLQEAINSAALGDEIVIDAGATLTGNFTLPVKSGSAWLIIRSSKMSALIEGKRVGPADSANMPKLISPNNEPVIKTAPSAHHYRLIGLEFKTTVEMNTLIAFGDGSDTTTATLASNLIIDRCWLHGQMNFKLRRGVALNCASTAVIDSYISDVHEKGSDAQALCGWAGPGPFKIVNNYLEASGENVMFGGADPRIPNLIPSDIEIRRNYFFKPEAWKPLWTIKALLELKNARRVLVEGNIFEHNWVDAQTGYAILLKSVNQEGVAFWSQTLDVDFKNNIVKSASAAVNIAGKPIEPSHPEYTAINATRLRIYNNLFIDIGGTWGGEGAFLKMSEATDVTIDHNTSLQTGNMIIAYDVPAQRFTFTNNIVKHGEYGVKGTGTGVGNGTLNVFFPGSVFKGNLIIGAIDEYKAAYPQGQTFVPDVASVGFIDASAGNYRLRVANWLGTDNKPVGADIDAIEAAMAGNAAPTPPIPPPPPPTPTTTTLFTMKKEGSTYFVYRDSQGAIVGRSRLSSVKVSIENGSYVLRDGNGVLIGRIAIP